MRIDPTVTAAAVLPLVGGPANVVSVAHCMTRLRLGLADPTRVDEEALRSLPGVLGLVVDDGSYQVVLGPGAVTQVTSALEALLAAPTDGEPPDAARGELAGELAARGDLLREERRRRNATPLKSALRRLANVFVPLIPALIGCGIVAGVNGLLVNAGLLPWLTPALAAVASGFMALIAVFVGLNTAKEFGGTPVLGGAVAAIVVYPGVA
ncbi:PTS transporter subunit EIIB, partial [Streptomyces sp. NPDC001856]